MATVNIRYIVTDVNAAIAFYTTHLGFGVERQPALASQYSRMANYG